MREMTARYSGICAGCGETIVPGREVAYDPETKLVYHPRCRAAAAIAAPFRLSGGSGYGCWPWSPGQVVHCADYLRERGYPEYVTVVRVGERYYGHDGMSFGVGDDTGYVYWAECREAAAEEIAAKRAEEDAAQKVARAKARVTEIARQIVNHGERPENAGVVKGDVLLDTQNVYGGGDWFVLQPDWIWYVRNNGADGDDWSRNNVATGGAGAIGWRIPFSKELANELRQLERLLGG